MLRVILGGLAGAVTLFVWGMLAWMALPIHEGTLHRLPDERMIVADFLDKGLKTGVYQSPMPAEPKPDATAADGEAVMKEWIDRRLAGPNFLLIYRAEGSHPMSPLVFGRGFAMNLTATLIAAFLVSLCGARCPTWIQRTGVVAMLGLFTALMGHGNLWNWMDFPNDWTIAMIVDQLLGWTIVGGVIAAIVRPPKTAR